MKEDARTGTVMIREEEDGRTRGREEEDEVPAATTNNAFLDKRTGPHPHSPLSPGAPVHSNSPQSAANRETNGSWPAFYRCNSSVHWNPANPI